jgi:hypothetical protein
VNAACSRAKHHVNSEEQEEFPDRMFRVGYTYIHSVLDDHSRPAYIEALGDERATTGVGFWTGAMDRLADRGVPVPGGAHRQRVMRRRALHPSHHRLGQRVQAS